jgi:hypothetical protein
VTWEFDPAPSQWTRKADLGDWVTGGPSTSMGEHGLVVCYANSHPRIYQYDPSINEWITRQSLMQYSTPYLFASYYNKKLHLAGKEMWELTLD